MMIDKIEALNFRCLRYVSQSLGNFHVLVGPNASGKTTFLDAVGFLGDIVSSDIEGAIEKRTSNWHDLTWGRSGASFELAVEFSIPDAKREVLNDKYDKARYEVQIGAEPGTDEVGILAERVLLLKTNPVKPQPRQRTMFPETIPPPPSLLSPKTVKAAKTVVNKVPGGNDNFYDETEKGWHPNFKLGKRKSALGSLPEDERKFPVSIWLKEVLSSGVQRFTLNSLLMRKPSPPGQPKGFRPDGSNLPWVVAALKAENPELLAQWIAHLQTALPDLAGVETIERPEDRHRYLVARYKNDLEAPSWLLSDGTLRMMALTLPAYMPSLQGLYLIEEPENGIHPRAIETVFQSLSSVFDAQVLVATHSPVIISVADIQQVLCFSKTAAGETDIVRGDEHPALRDWKGQVNLGDLFAGGVLG